jgi:hypothetical protein
MSSPTIDLSGNPFLNQVADDSIPWQEVKKRGVPAAQHLPAHKGKAPGIRDQAKVALAYGSNNQARARAISASRSPSDVPRYVPSDRFSFSSTDL